MAHLLKWNARKIRKDGRKCFIFPYSAALRSGICPWQLCYGSQFNWLQWFRGSGYPWLILLLLLITSYIFLYHRQCAISIGCWKVTEKALQGVKCVWLVIIATECWLDGVTPDLTGLFGSPSGNDGFVSESKKETRIFGEINGLHMSQKLFIFS